MVGLAGDWAARARGALRGRSIGGVGGRLGGLGPRDAEREVHGARGRRGEDAGGRGVIVSGE